MRWITIVLFSSLLLASCQDQGAPDTTTAALRQFIGRYPTLAPSEQIVVAQADSAGAFTGRLYGVERQPGHTWAVTFDTIGVTFGAAGVAPPGEKREGDRRSPSGAFGLGPAFGYAPFPGLAIPYIDLEDDHYWISESASPRYNQLVRGVPEESNVEKMLRDDELYEYGLVVQYNTEHPAPEMGSAIFIHIGRGMSDPTLGCIAMGRPQMIKLLRWLEAGRNPMIVME